MAKTLENLQNLWSDWDAATRSRFAVALVATFAILVGVGVWSSQTPYSTVLKGRQWEDVLDAAAALDAADVPYRVRDGALEVPSGELGAARGALSMSESLPGLSDVGELQLGLTPTAQAWAFLRAREGDLAGAVQSIDGVTAARVHIVPQRESLFVGEEEPARASVFLRLRPAATLAPVQIRAVANLVASSVDGLSADRVTVVDDRGNLLAEASSGADAQDAQSVPTQLLEYQTALERRYERAVTQSLLPVMGYDGGFSVTATVAVNHTQTDTVRKNVDTEKQAVLSEAVEEKSSAKNSPGGVPGVDSNVPSGGEASSAGTQQESSVTRTNYAYPTVDEVEHQPAGAVERVSVAVQVDSARLAVLAESAGIEAGQLSSRIEDAVRAAIGFDADRNDQVVVQFLPFTAMEEVPTATASTMLTTTVPSLLDALFPYVLALTTLGLAFRFVVNPLVHAATHGPRPATNTAGAPNAEGVDEANPLRPDEQVANRLKTLIDDFEPIDAQELSTLVNHQPQAAAKVLKQWQQSA